MKEINLDGNTSFLNLYIRLREKEAEKEDMILRDGKIVAIILDSEEYSASIAQLGEKGLLRTTSDFAGFEQHYLSEDFEKYKEYKKILDGAVA